uniref:Uncharacterized protein n=1 Tax=Faxonius propinquus nudivirus TaxID=3139431 RepID=A0AAU8GBF8_9VIRU
MDNTRNITTATSTHDDQYLVFLKQSFGNTSISFFACIIVIVSFIIILILIMLNSALVFTEPSNNNMNNMHSFLLLKPITI